MLSKIFKFIWNAIYVIGMVGGLVYVAVNIASEQVQVYIWSGLIIGGIMMVVNKFRKPPTKKD